jgi:hypothetical protein
MAVKASPSDLSRETFNTRTGFTLDELTQQCRERFLQVLGSDVSPWEDQQVDVKQRWTEAVWVVAELISQEVECKWRDLARNMARAFHGVDRWGSLSLAVKMAFEVMARHACNMIVAEDELDSGDAQKFDWVAWCIQRLNPEEE